MTEEPATSTGEKTSEGLSRRSVLRATGTAAVAGAVGTTAVGTASATTCCTDCVRLGKIDRPPSEGDSYEFDHDGETITIEVQGVEKEEGEVVCADFHNRDNMICGVDIKGGPATRTRRFEDDKDHCEDSDSIGAVSFSGCGPKTRGRARGKGRGRGPGNPNREFYGISHVVFYVCVTEE